jgi:metaxin
MSSTFTIPAPLRTFYSYFPLHTYPPNLPPTWRPITKPTLWILPPRNLDSDSLLSNDVECLKWQAFLALRGFSDIAVRWDVSPDGAIDGRLPNLHVPGVKESGELLAAHMIPGWVEKEKISPQWDVFEGYIDEAARDESHAWVALLGGKVHAALVLSQPQPSFLSSLLTPSASTHSDSLSSLLTPPPPPLSGISSLFPPYGTHISTASIESQYKEAIASLSERLGTDKWFLGSKTPTALDALAFAYLHTILHAKHTNHIRFEVNRRVNLVAWERRVRVQVAAAFQRRV